MPQGSSDDLPTLPISPFGDAARVDNTDFGWLVYVHNLVSSLDELTTNRRCLSEVELAAECMECNALHRYKKELSEPIEQLSL